ncbi:MAG: Na/Pi cotransporter family protein [Firmicutes bacterium]|jgi:phosphate:Na+ symporter|nr:Na/Pi cotransporter family protein [Bacillota bacterium]
MWLNLIFSLVGGLGLFFVGIQMMASGMQKAAGDKLRRILEALTANPLVAVFTGIVITILIQSSSTATVMVVGFVNAGIMTLSQAIATIIGSNIGTTLTAQIISFKIDFLALPAIGVGALLNFLGKRRLHKYIGQTILGFGLLFMGLMTMSAGMNPLKEMPAFQNMLIYFSDYPLLGVLAATAFTALIQNSGAVTVIIISLALQDAISFSAAVPFVLGANLGTCVTALIASFGASLSARRAVAAHIFFNLFGVVLTLLLLKPFTWLVMHTASTIPRQIANAHTLFNVFTAAIVMLFFNRFNYLIEKIVPGEEKVVERGSKYLDRRMLRTPEPAIAGLRQEIIRMGDIAREMLKEAVEVFIGNGKKKIKHVYQMEELVDGIEKEIAFFVADLSQHSLSSSQSWALARIMSASNDIERIGDHAQNILELAEEKIENRLPFSPEALSELRQMHKKVDVMLEKSILAFEREDGDLAWTVIKSDDEIDHMEKKLRKQHISRINEKRCYPASGVLFLDAISNLERAADHTVNIAESIIGEF